MEKNQAAQAKQAKQAQAVQPRKPVKVVFRSGSRTLKIAAGLLIVFSMAALTALQWVHNGIQEQTRELGREAAAVEYANEELETKKNNVGTVQGIAQIARDELGLVDPDTVFIDPEG